MEFHKDSHKDLLLTFSLTAIFVALMIALFFYDQRTGILQQIIGRFN
ncbi:MAG: hypothetical protein V1846_03100 [Candidatus Komeilibacteria bacterium]